MSFPSRSRQSRGRGTGAVRSLISVPTITRSLRVTLTGSTARTWKDTRPEGGAAGSFSGGEAPASARGAEAMVRKLHRRQQGRIAAFHRRAPVLGPAPLSAACLNPGSPRHGSCLRRESGSRASPGDPLAVARSTRESLPHAQIHTEHPLPTRPRNSREREMMHPQPPRWGGELVDGALVEPVEIKGLDLPHQGRLIGDPPVKHPERPAEPLLRGKRSSRE